MTGSFLLTGDVWLQPACSLARPGWQVPAMLQAQAEYLHPKICMGKHPTSKIHGTQRFGHHEQWKQSTRPVSFQDAMQYMSSSAYRESITKGL
jgi:hypothetical protein